MKRVFFFCLFLSLVGCKVGPDFVPPDAPVQEDWMDCEDALIDCDPPELSRWWEQFEDPTLNLLIDTAKAENLTLKAAGMRVLESRALLGVAIGQLFPQSQEAVASGTQYKLSKNAPNIFQADFHFWDFPYRRRSCLGTRFLGPFPQRH